MNPREFSWKEDQQVTVTNPTKDSYNFKVHGKDYIVGAGQTAKMPGYMAWVYVYGLACQMAQENSDWSHWNEEGFRKQYFDKLVVGVDSVLETIVPEPQVEAVETFEEEESLPSGGENYTPSIKPMTAARAKTNAKSAKS